VIERGQKTFIIEIGKQNQTISIDRLKEAYCDADVKLALPPRRGRPPRKASETNEILGGAV
jgi:hypothetical protein